MANVFAVAHYLNKLLSRIKYLTLTVSKHLVSNCNYFFFFKSRLLDFAPVAGSCIYLAYFLKIELKWEK